MDSKVRLNLSSLGVLLSLSDIYEQTTVTDETELGSAAGR